MNQGQKRCFIPAKKQRGHFVQTDRAAHAAWGRLAVKSPATGALLHPLVINVGERNAVVASHKVLAEKKGKHIEELHHMLPDPQEMHTRKGFLKKFFGQ